MKILVTGSRGQLGRELMLQADAAGVRVAGVDLPDFDLTRPDHIENAARRHRPDLLVNAAAYTAVDRAETEEALCMAVNRDGPRLLAEFCRGADLALVHVSTDFVFDGRKKTPYTEDDPPAPLGVYARSKAEGEKAVQDALSRHLILRTAWLYSVHGRNFVKTMLRLGAERSEISVVDDQYGCPTSAADLAGAILAIAGRLAAGAEPEWGIYHYCGEGVTTWYGFACEIFEQARRHTQLKVSRVTPITTGDYPTDAARPAYSALDCRKIEARFGIRPPAWRRSLAATIDRLYGAA